MPGTQIGELLPYTAQQMHRLALVRGINTKENNHSKGAYFMQTGRQQEPAMARLCSVPASASTPASAMACACS